MAYRLTNNEGLGSPSGAGLVRRGLSRLAAFAAALGRTLAEYPTRRRAYDELQAMTDRELADIGLTRYDVNRVFDPDFVADKTVIARGTPALRTIAGGAVGRRQSAPAVHATAPELTKQAA